MKRFLPFLLVVAALCTSGIVVAQSSSLYMVSNSNANIYGTDTSSSSTTNFGTLSPLGGGSISQCNGLAVHPCTGELFAIVQYGSSSGRSLAIVDTNSNALILGNTGDLVASIAFDNQGTLYAVTGDGATTPETMYTVDLSDGSMTFFQSLGNGSDGEAIAYCTDNGKMYHWSGWSSSLSTLTYESIDLNNNAVSNVGMTGTVSPTSIQSAAYIGNGQFVLSYHNNNGIGICDTNGLLVYSGGNTSVSVKGLAYQSQNQIGPTGTADGLCPGDTATLTSSSGSSYQWYLNGTSITGATSQDYTTTVAGQYNCVAPAGCYTDSSTFGFLLDSFSLPVVTVTGNDSGFCPGGVVSLTGSNGGQSQWFLNGDSVLGATTSSLLVSEEGLYNMTKTNLDGCADSAATGIFIEEFEEPDPDLGADAGLCIGDSIVLDAGFIAGANYIWVPFAQGQTLSVTDSGTYISIVTSAQGCTGLDTIHIEYNPEATVELGSDTVICDTASILLDAGSGLATYAWSTGESTQTVIIDMTSVPTGDTSVNVLVNVVNSFGCSAMDSVTVSFTECPDTTIGINSVRGDLVNVYPNPTNGTVILESNTDLTNVTIIDALGSVVFSNKLNSNRTQLTIDTPGLYFINIKDSQERTYIERVVVQ